jgi:hypothetical protein
VSKAIEESDSDPNAPAIPDSYIPGFSEDSLIQAFNLPKTPEDLEKNFPPVNSDDEGSKTG